MKPWQEELLCSLQAIRSEVTLLSVLVEEARKLGFDHCAYGLRLPLPLAKPRTVMLNNYPQEWRERYILENYVAIDPTVRHGMSSLTPLVWTDKLFCDAPAFWEVARSFGLRIGWAQSSMDCRGGRGMLTLARSEESLTADELARNGLRMVWLAQVSHVCMSNLLLPKLLPEQDVELSDREISVLRWSAEGKTSGEISEIIGISERTVNFHIARVMIKLNCANKTAATVRAALLGFLR